MNGQDMVVGEELGRGRAATIKASHTFTDGEWEEVLPLVSLRKWMSLTCKGGHVQLPSKPVTETGRCKGYKLSIQDRGAVSWML